MKKFSLMFLSAMMVWSAFFVGAATPAAARRRAVGFRGCRIERRSCAHSGVAPGASGARALRAGAAGADANVRRARPAGALDAAFDPARALRNLDVVFDRLAKLEVEGS